MSKKKATTATPKKSKGTANPSSAGAGTTSTTFENPLKTGGNATDKLKR